MAQRQMLHHRGNGRCLGGVFFHEFHAGGGVEEQIPHDDGGAHGAAGGQHFADFAAGDKETGTALRFGGAGENFKPGDGGNGG